MNKVPNVQLLKERAKQAFKEGNIEQFNSIIDDIDQFVEDISTYQAELRAQHDELATMRDKLDESNQKYKFLYDSAPTAYFTFNQHLDISSANQTAAKMLMMNFRDLIGKSISDFILPDYQDTFYLHVKSVEHFKHSSNCQIKIANANSKEIIVNVESQLVQSNGRSEIHSSFIDNSEVFFSRELIEEQQQLFEDLFHKAGDANLIISGDVFTDSNRKGVELFGFDSKDEIIGKFPHELSPEFQPCGKSSIEKAKEHIDYCFTNGVNAFEWVHTHKTRGYIYTDVMLTLIRKGGLNVQLVTLRDITQRKNDEKDRQKSEANLMAAIHYSPIAISLFSKDGLLLSFNEKFVSELEVHSGLTVSNSMSINEIINMQDNADFWNASLNTVLNGSSVRFEKKIISYDKVIYFELSLNPIFLNTEVSGFCMFISDISKFRQVEKILKESNEELERNIEIRTSELRQQADFLSLLLDSIPDLVFVKNRAGEHLNCNLAYSNYAGKSKSEIIGKTDAEVFLELDLRKFGLMDDDLFDANRTCRSEQYVEFLDGSKFVFDTIKTPYLNHNHEVLGLIGISRDVSENKKLEQDIKRINQELETIIEKRTIKLQQEIHERVRAEEALKKSREMYRNLFNDVPVGIYRTTINGSIILANPALVKMLGYKTLNELKARDLSHEGFSNSNIRKDFLNTILETDNVREFDAVWMKQDGTELFVREKAKAVKDYSNNVIYIEGTAEDITERRSAERMQQTVYGISEAAYKVQNIPELYAFIHKAVDKLIFARNFYISIYDEEKNEILFPYFVDEIESSVPSRLGPYQFSNGLTEYVINTSSFQLLNREQIRNLVVRGTLNTEGPTPVSWLGVPLTTNDNRIIGVLAVQSYDKAIKYDDKAKDILIFVSTQIAMVIHRKHIEEALYLERKFLSDRVLERTEELSALNAELERAVRTKDEFLANMSHELRTPLNAILGLSEILLKNKEIFANDKHRKALSTIRDSGTHLLNLINDILDLSKIEAGKMDLNYEELNVDNISNNCLSFVRQSAIKKSISISLKIADDCPTLFYADSMRIKQILINLLNNAVKFTSNNGVVGLDVDYNASKDALIFSVWDTGIGISNENIAKLFKPFTQLSSNLSRDYEGTGLGLSLVSKLTEMHGGSVSIESEEGLGSRFSIAIPIKNTYIDVSAFDSSNFQKIVHIQKALLIEDSADEATNLSNYLARLDIKSELYQFENDLIDTIESDTYDIVFLDILLWNRSGWKLLEIIKKNKLTSNIPVVITTVLKEREKAISLGASAFLNKPFALSKLYDIVHKIDKQIQSNFFSDSNQENINKAMEQETIVLLAEDNEANLQTLESFLEYAGFSVVIARNGREAIDTAAENNPDIILMDIQMPKMDGMEAIKIIKQTAKLQIIPIIALTALAMPGDKERCLAAGANQYLSKPVNFDTLINAMNSLLPEDKQRTGD